MQPEYIRQPNRYVQQELFTTEDSIYYSLDFPLFFETVIKWQFNENSFFLVAKDFSYLLVSGFGVKLAKKSERLQIKENKKLIFELPFFRLHTVAIFSKGVSVSSDLLEQFVKNNINLSFHDYSGKPYALLQSMYAPQHINLKREQLLAQNSVVGNNLIVKFVTGKISNQISLLKYITKNLKPTNENNIKKINSAKYACSKMQECYDKVVSLINSNDLQITRAKLMGYEGTSARIYWKSISALLAEKTDFDGRQQKLPTDAVNTLLNYGYGILYSQIWSAIILAGLDPYIGFLHVEQTGKPSLVFDLIEEFRAPIVDRTVIAFVMLNRNIKIEQGLLTLETRQAFSEKLIDRLSSTETYMGKKFVISDIILLQARRLINCITNKDEIYKPFSFKW